jgi:hypothetical protein
MGLSWSFRTAESGKCPFSSGAECGGADPRSPEHKCSNCGWNPAVAKKRIKKWHLANADKDFSQVVARIRRRNIR